MKDLMGKTARIQVQSGPVLEVTNPKYSDEGAMLNIPHSEDGEPEWTPCNMVEVLEVRSKDGTWPSEVTSVTATGGKGAEESALVVALREQLEEQAGAMASQAKNLDELKAMVAQLSKGASGEPPKLPPEPAKGASALPQGEPAKAGTPNAQATANVPEKK